MGGGRPALVLMASQPLPGAVKTRLCPPFSPESAARIAEAMLADTLGCARRADCAEIGIAFTPASSEAWFRARFPGLVPIDQGEGDPGSRMRNVTRRCWTRRAFPLALVGPDSPDLPPEYIRSAFEALQPGPAGADVAIGPAPDGGYYLIALRAPCDALFTDLPGEPDELCGATLERAQARGLKAQLLPLWQRVDTAQDIDALRARVRAAPPAICPATRALLRELAIEE